MKIAIKSRSECAAADRIASMVRSVKVSESLLILKTMEHCGLLPHRLDRNMIVQEAIRQCGASAENERLASSVLRDLDRCGIEADLAVPLGNDGIQIDFDDMRREIEVLHGRAAIIEYDDGAEFVSRRDYSVHLL